MALYFSTSSRASTIAASSAASAECGAMRPIGVCVVATSPRILRTASRTFSARAYSAGSSITWTVTDAVTEASSGASATISG